MVGADVGLPVFVTVKIPVDVTEPPALLTVICPVVAPAGTVQTICVALAELTAAVPPGNATVLPAVVATKFVPVIVTEVPAGPLVGLRPVIVGAPVAAAGTVNSLTLVHVPPGVAMLIRPVVAPTGTEQVISVVVMVSTTAVTPLNATAVAPAVVSKLVPTMVTPVPTAPVLGVKLVIVGACAPVPPVPDPPVPVPPPVVGESWTATPPQLPRVPAVVEVHMAKPVVPVAISFQPSGAGENVGQPSKRTITEPEPGASTELSVVPAYSKVAVTGGYSRAVKAVPPENVSVCSPAAQPTPSQAEMVPSAEKSEKFSKPTCVHTAPAPEMLASSPSGE